MPLCPATSTTASLQLQTFHGRKVSVAMLQSHPSLLSAAPTIMHAMLSIPIKAPPRLLNRGKLADQHARMILVVAQQGNIPYSVQEILGEISSMCRAVGQRTRTHHHLVMYVSAIATLSSSPSAPEHGVVSINVGKSESDNLLAKIAVSCG